MPRNYFNWTREERRSRKVAQEADRKQRNKVRRQTETLKQQRQSTLSSFTGTVVVKPKGEGL
jgi:hypothetical protein